MLVGWRLLQLLHAKDVDTVLQGVELAGVVAEPDFWEALFREAHWMPDWPSRQKHGRLPWMRLELRQQLRGQLDSRAQEQTGLLALLSAAPEESRQARRLRDEAVSLCLDPAARTGSLSWLRLPGLQSLGLWGWEQASDLPPADTLFLDSPRPLPEALRALHLERAAQLELSHPTLEELVLGRVTALQLDCPALRKLTLISPTLAELPVLPPTLEELVIQGGKVLDVSSLHACPRLTNARLPSSATGWIADDAAPLPAITLAELSELVEALVERQDLALCGPLEELVEDLLQPLRAALDGEAPQDLGAWLSAWLLDHPLVDDLFVSDEHLRLSLRRFA